MLPRSCLRCADSKSNSSTRLPRRTTTRVSSGWVASMSILLAIGKSHKGRHACSLHVAVMSDAKSDLAREKGTGPMVGEWDGLEVPRSGQGPREGQCAGERVKATAPRWLDLDLRFADKSLGHELQTAMRRQRRALPQFL